MWGGGAGGRSGVGAENPALDPATSQEIGVGTPGLDPGCQGMTRTKAEITDYSPGGAKPTVLWRSKSWLRARACLGKLHVGGGI